MIRRADIRWYRFSKPDKRRPVLILTRDSAIPYLGELSVAPLTTTIRNIPSEVHFDQHDGVPRLCAVNLDHVQTVSKGKIEGRITSLGRDRMAEVRRALLFALGFGNGPASNDDEGARSN